jgi:leucine-rich repeat protein SHOC2
LPIPLSAASCLTRVPSLSELHLDRNQLTAVPDTIGNVTNLIRLNLSRNRLTVVPDTIGNLTDLLWLHLSGNRLTAVRVDLPEWTKVTV